MFICPQPQAWNAIHRQLDDLWRKGGRIGRRPPIPLILAGWAYSDDAEKKERWDATIQWACERGMEHLIPELSPEDSYNG